MPVEFRLLGSVEGLVDGVPVEVGPARQRCVLAALLADANQPVSADQLIDRAWGNRAPQRALGTLRTYLSRLRRALAATSEVELGRRAGGYVLAVEEAAVDLHRFRTLVAHARAAVRDEHALALLDQALGLWRGEAFAGLDTPWIVTLRHTLEAERLAAELDHIDLRLRRGQHGDLLAELAAKAAVRPMDERLAGQLMLTLYRCGRQADALATYQQLRSRLAEELGADPSPPVQAMHQQILTANPALTVLAVNGAGSPSSPVPRQLPAPPGAFAGRRAEQAALTAALDGAAGAGVTAVISAVAGVGGIGKTWLTLHWAHRHADRFPDGQLFVDLRGFTSAGQPMPPGAALRGFLDALGVEPGRIPVELDAQTGLYRSLVAAKRMLIVLDNARDTTQVIPLLPGSPSCTVVVTSRDRLAGLVTAHGAHPVALDVLSEAEARDLLTRRLGPARLAAEPHAVAELLSRCAGLPLALGIVGGRAIAHPTFPLAALATELRDAASRLGALDTGDPTASLSTVLSWSWNALTAEQAKLFGLLGLVPGPDIGLPAAASLSGLSTTRTGAVLRELEGVSLLQQHTPGRWQMHDLVRLYAATRARHDQPQDDRDAALRRLVDHYIHTAYTGDLLLEPRRTPIDLEPATPGSQPRHLPDDAAAFRWFDAEHSCLLATQHLAADQGWHRAVWQLAWSLTTFHHRRGKLQDQVTAWQHALTAARHSGEPAIQSAAHRRLGDTYARVGRHTDALEHLHQALALAEDTRDLTAQAHAHQALAMACEHQGKDQLALEHATHALRRYQALGNPAGEADALNAVGWFATRLGHHAQARTHCQAALALCRRHHDRAGEAATLDSLGYLAHQTGQHTQALDHYQLALTRYRDVGNTYGEADTLDRLGHTHTALGHHDHARDTWQQALRLYQTQHRTHDAERIQRQLEPHPPDASVAARQLPQGERQHLARDGVGC